MANPNPSPQTRFKTGQIANPRGAAAHDHIGREIKQLTLRDFREVVQAALTSDLTAIAAIANNPNESMLKVGVARALLRAVKRGDWKVLSAIVDRVIGKTPESVELRRACRSSAVITEARKRKNITLLLSESDSQAAIAQLEEKLRA